jgi:hypothetical protein
MPFWDPVVCHKSFQALATLALEPMKEEQPGIFLKSVLNQAGPLHLVVLQVF